MILDPSLTAAYVIVAIALALAPGPDVLFVLASGLRHKARGAIAAAFGVGAGSFLHAIAAAVGVSAIVASSALAFDLLRFAGALYLAYLGLLALRSWYRQRQCTEEKPSIEAATIGQVFRSGLVTNVLNPKVIVFYLALLPQFVAIELGQVGLQMFLLGCIHNVIGVVFLIVVGFTAGRASEWLATTGFQRWMDGVAGVFFVALAMRLALSERPER